jgi:microcystin-dependent protein
MPAPIRPSEICALVPSGTSSLCDRILKVFIQLPAKICAWATWMFNEDGTLTDAFKDEAQIIPTGTVIARLSTTVPNGWLACNGAEVSRTTYALLFSIIGTIYGAGNGTTTFNLPNFQDKFLYGKGSTSSVGDSGGEADHTLTIPELPSGHMPVSANNYPTGRFANHGEAVTPLGFTQGDPDPTTAPIAGGYLALPGSDTPFNLLPPYSRVQYLIKT